MAKDWQVLSTMTGGAPIEIERVRIVEGDIAIEGRFELPPLARLTAEDQVFVAAFVRCHGSIKQMEKFFGVSYPTIKNRLNRIGRELSFVNMALEADPNDLLDRLESGEMTAGDVIARLKKDKQGEKQ